MSDDVSEAKVLCNNILIQFNESEQAEFLFGYHSGYSTEINGITDADKLRTYKNYIDVMTDVLEHLACFVYGKDKFSSYKKFGEDLGLFSKMLQKCPYYFFLFMGDDETFENLAINVIHDLRKAVGKDRENKLLTRINYAVNALSEEQLDNNYVRKGVKRTLEQFH